MPLFKCLDRFIPHGPRSVTLLCLAASIVGALAPTRVAWACTSPAPPPSFCGDPGCGTLFCNTRDNVWDCAYATGVTPCAGGYCDGSGYCTSRLFKILVDVNQLYQTLPDGSGPEAA